MTTQKILEEIREIDITEEEIQFVRDLRESLKDEKDREAFMELMRESPFLLTAVRKMRTLMTSYAFLRKMVLWLLAALLTVNILSTEIGKMLSWLLQPIK